MPLPARRTFAIRLRSDVGSSDSAFNSSSSAILPRSKRVATLVRLAFVVGADSLGYGQLETATAWNIPAFP